MTNQSRLSIHLSDFNHEIKTRIRWISRQNTRMHSSIYERNGERSNKNSTENILWIFMKDTVRFRDNL